MSGLFRGSLASFVDTENDVSSWETAEKVSGSWSVFVTCMDSLLLLLLLASVVATTRVEVRGSVERLIGSSERLLVSVKVSVCSVSAGKKNIKKCYDPEVTSIKKR